MPPFLADTTGWLREGRRKYREDVLEATEAAPRAFIGLTRAAGVADPVADVMAASQGFTVHLQYDLR